MVLISFANDRDCGTEVDSPGAQAGSTGSTRLIEIGSTLSMEACIAPFTMQCEKWPVLSHAPVKTGETIRTLG